MNAKADERLQHDHVELGELLNQLDTALKANDVARTHATLDLFWARLAMHIRAEHLHLFPAISRISKDQTLPRGEPENTITILREDHDFFMRELAQAIAITRNAKENTVEQLEEVDRTIAAVRDRLVKHHEIEETGIYVWSNSLFSEAEQSELETQIQKELENLPPRFGDVDGSQ